jgi:DNA polymerase bacteriophage-type
MKRWFLDFESFWSADYSLTKMTPVEYIMDPRFELHGCAFVDPSNNGYWVDGNDLGKAFAKIKWNESFVTSHNALFDMLVLKLRYGIGAGFYGCTLSMARNWVAHATGKGNLKTVAEYYALPPKGDVTSETKGKSLAMIMAEPGLYERYKEYAIHDARLCQQIFVRMLGEGFPVNELNVIDMVVRMACEPQFEADVLVLGEHLAAVKAKKEQLLRDACIDQDNIGALMSDNKLMAMLLQLGVTPPTKVSAKTGKENWAFAKTDKQFTALLEHPEPMVQAIVAARLGHKSTLEETRTQRLIDVSRVTDRLPVPLKYSGAHTHRFSGDWKLNLQNLTNDSPLRKGLKAPEGRAVLSADASQIEARINAVLSGQDDLVEDFRSGVDVYSVFAEEIYGYPVSKFAQPVERFVGKQSILSLGYQSSWPVFQNMLRVKGDVHLKDHEATTIVEHYRRKYRHIKNNWHFAQNALLPAIANGWRTDWGPVRIEKYAIVLPNGNRLYYDDLRNEFSPKFNKFSWSYRRGGERHYLYGAKLVENVVQALAFVFIMECALTLKKQSDGYFLPAHQVHDELIYLPLDKEAHPLKHMLLDIMSTPPAWMPSLPVAAEVKIGNTYGDT